MSLPSDNIHDWTLHEYQCADAVLWVWREGDLTADIWVRVATGEWCWAIESENGVEVGHGTGTNLEDALAMVRDAARGVEA